MQIKIALIKKYSYITFIIFVLFIIRLNIDNVKMHSVNIEKLNIAQTHLIEIRDDPEYKYFSTQAIAIDQTIKKHILLAASSDTGGKLQTFQVGDKFLAKGYYTELNEYESYLKEQHIYAKFTLEKIIQVEQGKNIIEKMSNYFRNQMLNGCGRLGIDTQGICEGLLIGEKSHISKQTYSKYKDAQLTHLLVASGANIVFIITFLTPILKRMKLRLKYGTMCFVAIFYCILTRFEPSILRATIMVCLPSIARIRGHRLNEYKIFFASIIVCLFIDPFLIYRVGFWLSASATGGLYFLTPKLKHIINSDLIASTLGATIAVQPILWIAFGFNWPFKWPISVVAIAIAEPLSTIGFVFTYLSSYIDTSNIFASLFSNLMHVGCWLLNITASFGQSIISSYLGMFLTLFLIIAYNRSRGKERCARKQEHSRFLHYR